jgi:putative SOS response-associated peptidase YedK
LFGLLTTTANAIVAPFRPKATPVILKTPDEVDVWLSAETKDALELQRLLPDGALKIVARGERSDGKDLALDVADSGSVS